MKRRIISFLLAWVMLLSVLHGIPRVHASGEEQSTEDAVIVEEEKPVEMLEALPARAMVAEEDAVAKVDDIYFSSLEEAIASIQEQGTITILTDINSSTSFIIPKGKKITIQDDGTARTILKTEFDNINPLFIVENGATLSIEATADENLILAQDQIVGLSVDFRNKGNIIHNKGMFFLKSGTIHPGGLDRNADFSGGIYVDRGATFEMSGGIIEEMNAYDAWYTAPVFVSAGATFNLAGGVIRNNKNDWEGKGPSGAGGVLLFVWNENDPIATMQMTGGKIIKNSAINGGGVYMTGRTKFHMSGGLIAENEAFDGSGGGVCVSARSGVDHPNETEFRMTGGAIRNNTARNGGGIYVNSDQVFLESGDIEGNVAQPSEGAVWSGHGGGVYVSEVPRVLTIGKTIVTENKAVASSGTLSTSGMGGGLWACPTGSINLNVTNGIAVFNNKATGKHTAGDDIVKVAHDGSLTRGSITVPDRMLGGGQILWYRDGAVESGTVGHASTTMPRFSPDQPGNPVSIEKVSDNLAVKGLTTQTAIDRAYEEATLFIRNNTAAHGGGIGTNGDIAMPNFETPDWTLKVKKVWDPGIEGAKKDDVEIFLSINGKILDSVKLNAANQWMGAFKQLPSPESLQGKKISVIEGERVQHGDGRVEIRETTRWEVSYKDIAAEDEYTLMIEVNNKELPPPETSESESSETPPVSSESESSELPSESSESVSSETPPISSESESSEVPPISSESVSSKVPPISSESEDDELPPESSESESSEMPPPPRKKRNQPPKTGDGMAFATSLFSLIASTSGFVYLKRRQKRRE